MIKSMQNPAYDAGLPVLALCYRFIIDRICREALYQRSVQTAFLRTST
jgi:hypothetical protein